MVTCVLFKLLLDLLKKVIMVTHTYPLETRGFDVRLFVVGIIHRRDFLRKYFLYQFFAANIKLSEVLIVPMLFFALKDTLP